MRRERGNSGNARKKTFFFYRSCSFMEMTLEVVMVVVSMEVDKVVDEVPDMVADRSD